jgi:HK97 family phage major capsid protein
MKTSVELRQLQAQKRAEGANIVSKAENEKRELTSEELVSLRSIETEVKTFDTEISNAELREKFAADKVANNPTPIATPNSEKRELENFSFGKLIREMSISRGDENGVTGFEREILQESAKEKRELGSMGDGLYLSNRFMQVEKRTMSAGSSTAGGNFIATEKVGFFDALYAKTVLPQLGAVKLEGLAANTDLTGFSAGVTAGWATEVADASSGDPTTASRSISPKRLTAYVDLSKQLLLQNNYSIQQYTTNSFLKAFAVAIEAAAINGSGSSGQPTGLLGTSGIGSVAIGTNGGAPTLAKILELIQVVETANAGMNGKFLVNPKVVAKLKQTVIDSGSGAMIMPYMSYFMGQPEQIAGKETYSTSNVPSNLTKGTASGICSAIIFGDWENLVVGQYGGIDLVVDPASQAIGGKTRIVMNQYVGVAVKQPAAFAAILDATTT